MAIFHCSVSVGSRSQGRSATASVSYREGSTITDELTGQTHNYSRKKDVIESVNLLPSNAPEQFKNTSSLWNAVERVEKRKDAQVFREVEVSLPKEFTHEQNKALTLSYVQENFVNKGMCATVSFHVSKSDNPHAHIMLTTRTVDQDGFGQKNRDWNHRGLVEQWRENWAQKTNEHMKSHGVEQILDHRSYLRQGLTQEPTIHLGHVAHAMEQRGEHSSRGDVNRAVSHRNEHSHAIHSDVFADARSAHVEHVRQAEREKERTHELKMAQLKEARIGSRESRKSKGISHDDGGMSF